MSDKISQSYLVKFQGYLAGILYYNSIITKTQNELNAFESKDLELNDKGEFVDQEKINELIQKTESVIKSIQWYAPSYFVSDCNNLAARCVALKYRTAVQSSEVSEQSVIPEDKKKLITEHIEKFKIKQHAIDIKELTNDDQLVIDEVLKYPEFADLLINPNNEQMRKYFFKFTILYRQPVQIFVEYPHLAHRLLRSGLASRIGCYKDEGLVEQKEMLKIEKLKINDTSNIFKKTVTLPFVMNGNENKGKLFRASVLDENTRLDFGSKVETVGQIFQKFHERHDNNQIDCGMSEDGITLFNDVQFDGIDFSKKDWFLEMPIFKTITKEAAETRFGISNEGEWGIRVSSNSKKTELDFGGTHAFVEIAIPNKEGNYKIFAFGKYPKRFPSSALGLLWFLGNTVPGNIVSDHAVFSLDRKFHANTRSINEETGYKLMERIKKDILKGRDSDNLIFQTLQSNCAEWVVDILNEVVNDHEWRSDYQMHVLDAEPSDFIFSNVYKVGRFIRDHFPLWLSHLIISLSSLVLLPCRGMWVEEDTLIEDEKKTELGSKEAKKVWKWKSNWNTGYFNNHCIYHPIRPFINHSTVE